MKAVYIAQFGGPQGLDIGDVPDPRRPAAHEVLVKVKTAGLNRADLLQVGGRYPPPRGYSPNIPGLEFAGEVVSVGSEVAGWKGGDRVFGIAAGEAQAEYLVTDATLLARIPENLTFDQAGAVPEVFITAHDACFTQGELKQNETLLIHAVGSGVGLAGLQLARAKGATVIGTSRTPDKLERCKQFGLDLGVETGVKGDFSAAVAEHTGGKGADVILDLVGASYFEQNLASLAVKGRLILVGLTSGAKADVDLGVVLRTRARIIGTVLRGRTIEEKSEATDRFAREVVPLLASGVIVPNLDRVFPVEDAVTAYKYLASNESFGKVVLEF